MVVGAAAKSIFSRAPTPSAAESVPQFSEVYEEHFALVWRNLRRLGVPRDLVADAAQDVFLVVFRRLGDFEPRGSIRAWVFAIVASVARTHRRTIARKAIPNAKDPDTLVDRGGQSPQQSAEQSEAVALLEQILGRMGEDSREVLVLAELEQMTAPEIAEALGINPNTVYSRLRTARREFDAALARHDARERSRS